MFQQTSFRRLVLASVLIGSVGACGVDLRRPPEAQWSTRLGLFVVHAYQRTLSPWMPGAGIQCRFTPTCSRYAEAVLEKHGAARGSWLTFRRLARCGPWTAMGTVDEP